MIESPDTIIIDTFAELVRGKASVADVQASIDLAFELPGWELLERERRELEHLRVCPGCIVARAAAMRAAAFLERIFGQRIEVVHESRLTEALLGQPTIH